MSLETKIQVRGFALDAATERRILLQLENLERRLVHRPEPIAVLVLTEHPKERRVTADLRVQLSPLGSHLISHQHAETPEHAVRLAVADLERQLERRTAAQRGEASFGVPSRREPKELRPHPDTRGTVSDLDLDESAELEE